MAHEAITRLKTAVLVGHSQAEGFAGTSPMIQAAPWLATRTSPVDAKYKNIRVFTSDLPWPGPSGTPPVTLISSGAWLDMNTVTASSPLAAHPYPSPWQYPNTRSVPLTPDRYDGVESGLVTGGGTMAGIELPLMWHVSHLWGEPAGLVKLAIPATTLLRVDIGVFAVPFVPYAWWNPETDFDWHPTTARLYQKWLDKMTGAQAALAPDKMDVQFLVGWFGDNDSSLQVGRIGQFRDAYLALVNKMRQACVENDWTTLPAHKIPWLAMGIYRTYKPNVAALNNVLKAIQLDDPWFRYIDTTGFQSLLQAGYVDDIHLSHQGNIDAATAVYNAYVGVLDDTEDALSAEQRITRAEARDRVLNYYERNRTRTDADTEIVDQYLNGALFHILNTVGDQAWWIRQIREVALTGGPRTPTVLPDYIQRPIRIERKDEPNYPTKFELLGHQQGGKSVIIFQDQVSETFRVHYIQYPKEMTQDHELVPLPFQLVEWMIVETCRRLARSSGNMALEGSLFNETMRLQNSAMRHIGAVQRSRFERIRSQRRMIGGGLGWGPYYGGPWGR